MSHFTSCMKQIKFYFLIMHHSSSKYVVLVLVPIARRLCVWIVIMSLLLLWLGVYCSRYYCIHYSMSIKVSALVVALTKVVDNILIRHFILV